MLSYRHAFHAGNYADVLKHIVQIEVLQHLLKKDKTFDYFDTHAGAGLYGLKGKHAQTTGEYKEGYAKLSATEFPELEKYFSAVAAVNNSINSAGELVYYPGSPLIAQQLLRRQDRSWLFEIHPTDLKTLQKNISQKGQTRINDCDGFTGLLPLLPPVSKRGLILIDPPYEIKTDYDIAVKTLICAHKRFATGTYMLWYPVVERTRIDRLEKKLIHSGIKNIQLFELGREPDHTQTDTYGMTAAGIIVINPPWTLKEKMQALMPKLATALGKNNRGHYRCITLAEELSKRA